MPRNWTDEEKRILINYVIRKHTFARMARNLDRSEQAVKTMFNSIMNTIVDKGYYELTLVDHRVSNSTRDLLNSPVYVKVRIGIDDEMFNFLPLEDEVQDMEIEPSVTGQRPKKRTRVEV